MTNKKDGNPTGDLLPRGWVEGLGRGVEQRTAPL